MSGERLENGEYVALPIEQLPGGGLQGYSPVLDLNMRWEEGELVFYDLATDRPIATLEDEREARADTAEARVRELEDLLHRQDP